MRSWKLVGASIFVLTGASLADAAPLQEARVTRLYNDVALLLPNQSARPAAVNDVVRKDIAIRTGQASKAELQYRDKTLVRLGAQTLFTFDPSSRTMDLGKGLILFQIPKGAGGAEIRTGAITAAITGTTGFIARSGNTFKVVLLEGSLRVSLNDRLRESMQVKAGQMLFGQADAKSMRGWQAVDVDVRKLMRTSQLLNEKDFGELSEDAEQKISTTITQQDRELGKGGLVATNLAVKGLGTDMALTSDPRQIAGEHQRVLQVEEEAKKRREAAKMAAARLAEAKEKEGKKAPERIIALISTNPAAPLLTALDGTAVAGSVYAGPRVDGAASTALFGTTNSFDAVHGFDTRARAGRSGTFPAAGLAVFQLEEVLFDQVDPMFDTASGLRDIALVSANQIHAKKAGIDLSNLDSLLLASMSGGINLERDTTFFATAGSGFQTLHLYNRSGKKLEVDSSFLLPEAELIMDSGGDVDLKKNATIQAGSFILSADQDVKLDGTLQAALVEIEAGGNLEVREAIDATKEAGEAGGIVDLSAGGEITIEKAIAVSDSAPGQENSAAGSITVRSTRTSGTAIEIKNSGQLHSLLSALSAGPGGRIELQSAGGDIVVDGGSLVADRGVVDVRNAGASGEIHLKNATISAEVVKVAALGQNGTLNVGGGSIHADTALRLYASGSNGQIVFDDHVSLNGNSAKIISAHAVTIKDNKVVTINGPGAAKVYTNTANYTGSGGNNSTSGTFGGQGASTLPHAASPGLDD